METVTQIIHAPETITFGLVVAGVLLTKVIVTGKQIGRAHV